MISVNTERLNILSVLHLLVWHTTLILFELAHLFCYQRWSKPAAGMGNMFVTCENSDANILQDIPLQQQIVQPAAKLDDTTFRLFSWKLMLWLLILSLLALRGIFQYDKQDGAALYKVSISVWDAVRSHSTSKYHNPVQTTQHPASHKTNAHKRG